jgi:membrane protein implicated in regulation of membrane protease activity
LIQIDVSDSIFLFCLLIGGGLLLVSIVLGEILGGVTDAIGIDHDMGGSGIVPPILAFVALFGAGGLFARQVLNMNGTGAAIVGIVAGAIGAASVGLLFRVFRRSEAGPEFQLEDVVGSTGRIKVSVGPTGFGEVEVVAMGAPRSFTATSASPCAVGSLVRVTGVAGAQLVVEPLTSTTDAPGPQPAATTPPSDAPTSPSHAPTPPSDASASPPAP